MKPSAQIHSSSYYLTPLGRNTSLSTLFSNRRKPSSPLKRKTEVSQPKWNRQNYSSVYFQLYVLKQETGKQDPEMTGSNHSQILTFQFLCAWNLVFCFLPPDARNFHILKGCISLGLLFHECLPPVATRVMASSFLRFLDHTTTRQSVGLLWTSDQLVADLYPTTYNTHNRQISMPPVGFEPTISAGERP